MSFSVAQFEAVVAEIQGGLSTFSADLDKVQPAARKATGHWYVSDSVAEAVHAIADKSVEVGKEIINWIIDLLKGTVAPIYMAIDAWNWMDIRGEANGVSGNLTDQNLSIDDSDWSGSARDAYATVVAAQSAAAARIGSIAMTTSANLIACAVAGAAFYVLLAAVLQKLIAATVFVIGALGSIAFSWVGLGIMLEEAAVNTAAIWAGVGTLTAF
ncbi:hypothetical protein [Actinoplanes sp. NBRC 101535]|nr:hypothetical protein [Actinoplanes sp. NBRC 101535]GLY01717.1 hypothetical protein Acsp01_20960 [Actinoplanes sp. NBRC 101535]